MLDSLEQLKTLSKANLPDEKEEVKFHTSILNATYNPVMQTFGKLVALQCEQKGVFWGSKKKREKSAFEHRAIFEAIEKQDGELAGKLIYEHIMSQ